MASYKVVIISLVILLAYFGKSSAKLSANYYRFTCRKFKDVVHDVLENEFNNDRRMLASILRLHFHDCFVNGCDGSILLSDTSYVKGEMGAAPNWNSVRGFKVIESIKTNLEKMVNCSGVVSCADILTLAARESVVLLGGPTWDLAFGRRDGYVTQHKSKADAVNDIPKPSMNIDELKKTFSALNFDTTELVALAGAHTVGQARCTNFRTRIYSKASPINSTFAKKRQATCPKLFGDDNLAPLDLQTPLNFDNSYYKNLIVQEGLLHSDQELHYHNRESAALVNKYSKDQAAFFTDFSKAMTKMSLLNPLTGTKGEIRKICSKVN